MAEWFDPYNLKRMLDRAQYHRTNIYLTHEQWMELADYKPVRAPFDFDWMYRAGQVSPILGTPVIVVDSVTDSTPFKMGMLP